MSPRANKLIDDFANKQSENTMLKLINFARSGKMTNDDIVYLSIKLAKSGNILSLPSKKKAADIASTGGPTSLSTLLCPLFLVNFGYWVPKLSVPGRPAGGVDVLAQIPSFKVELNHTEVTNCLKKCGYAHFLSGPSYTPLDSQLFSFRKKKDAVAIRSLVIASIISKKIAVGLTEAGLDIRVFPQGNFGSNWIEAKENARKFISVSKKLGINLVCFLTDARFPFQPFIGRGESLLALKKIFEGDCEGSLLDHFLKCYSMSLAIAKSKGRLIIPKEKLKNCFEKSIEAQGSSYLEFINKASRIEKLHISSIRADNSGFLNIDLMKLRSSIVWAQNQKSSPRNRFPDPCGIILKKTTGDYVYKNEIIATFRSEKDIANKIANNFESAFTLSNNLQSALGYEEVNYE